MSTNIIIKPDNTNLRNICLVVLAATLWSFSGLLIKKVNLTPIAIAGCRSGISAFVIYLYLGKPKFSFSKYQIGCAVAYTLMIFTFVIANKMTTSANAILLQYTSPIYVAILGAWFLNEKTDVRDWITIAFVIIGMLLFFRDGFSASGFWGNILSIFSGMCMAAFSVLMRKQKNEAPIESVLLGNILTALVSLPFIFTSKFDLQSCTWLVILGVFQLGIPYILFSAAIKHLKALESVLIAVIEPVLNPIWVFLFIGEIPGKWALIGGFIVVSSITIRYAFFSKNIEAPKIE